MATAVTDLQQRILDVLPDHDRRAMRTSRVATKVGYKRNKVFPVATALRGLERRGLVEWGYVDREDEELIKEWRKTSRG